MLKLFKFEFRKLFQSKSFWICTIISVLYSLLPAISNKIWGYSRSRYSLIIDSIPAIVCQIIIGVFIAIYVTEDDETGAIKTIYAKGFNRTKVFISKYIVSLFGTLFMIFITMLLSYLFGLIYWSDNTLYQNTWFEIVCKKMIIVIAFHAVYYAFACAFSKIIPSIIFNVLGPYITVVVLSLIESIISKALNNTNIEFTKYELSCLLLYPETISVNVYLVCSIYIVVFIVIGYLLNRRKEV